MNPKSLGQRITYYRKKIGMSQKDLAAAVGLSPNAVSGYEKNKREPNTCILISLAKILNVTCDTLLGVKHPNNLVAQNSNERDWLQSLRALNGKGQTRALEYIADLKDLARYTSHR